MAKKRRRELEWGQSPWDSMPREALLREMQRAYGAVQAARSVLGLLKGPEPSPFWKQGGSGHRALAMCEAVVQRVESKFDSENVYRAFYRYANDLLFDPALGFGWAVCTRGHMLGRTLMPDGTERMHTACSACADASPMRPLEWGDITPTPLAGTDAQGTGKDEGK